MALSQQLRNWYSPLWMCLFIFLCCLPCCLSDTSSVSSSFWRSGLFAVERRSSKLPYSLLNRYRAFSGRCESYAKAVIARTEDAARHAVLKLVNKGLDMRTERICHAMIGYQNLRQGKLYKFVSEHLIPFVTLTPSFSCYNWELDHKHHYPVICGATLGFEKGKLRYYMKTNCTYVNGAYAHHLTFGSRNFSLDIQELDHVLQGSLLASITRICEHIMLVYFSLDHLDEAAYGVNFNWGTDNVTVYAAWNGTVQYLPEVYWRYYAAHPVMEAMAALTLVCMVLTKFASRLRDAIIPQILLEQ